MLNSEKCQESSFESEFDPSKFQRQFAFRFSSKKRKDKSMKILRNQFYEKSFLCKIFVVPSQNKKVLIHPPISYSFHRE